MDRAEDRITRNPTDADETKSEDTSYGRETVHYLDIEHPESWPLQFFESGRLRTWPETLLARVSDQLAAAPEVTIDVAFVKLMVQTEMERRERVADGATIFRIDGESGFSENAA